ncbi:MAG: P-loop NTPase fold protein [Prolixibacteraceae bacterium]
MEPKTEYFNLLVEREEHFNDMFKDVFVSVITKEEVFQYFDYLAQKKLGKQPIGSKKVEIIDPDSYRIYDFSNFTTSNPAAVKSDYINAVDERLKNGGNHKEIFNELGKDVTESFGIRLEEILSNNEITKTTKTKIIAAGTYDEETGSAKIFTEDQITDLTKQIQQYFPSEFSGRIIDNSINPAFNVEQIAEVFGNLLKGIKHESGQMVGVFGKWGRGKTYFVEEVCKQLKINFKEVSSSKDSEFVFIKFQAWKYQNAPAVWAYLYDTISKSFFQGNWFIQKRQSLLLSIKRQGWFDAIILPLFVLIFGILWYWFIDKPSLFGKAIQLAGGLIPLTYLTYRLIMFYRFSKKPFKSIIQTLTKTPSFEHILGTQAEIQKEIVFLLRAWENGLKERKNKWYNFLVKSRPEKRILLFIDDLDRCSEKQMIEIIDNLRVILDDQALNKKLIILVAVDESKLEKAIEFKYTNPINTKPTDNKLIDTLTSEYLDKLFISAIKLPPISPDERSVFVENLAEQINQENPLYDSMQKSSVNKVEDKDKYENLEKELGELTTEKVEEIINEEIEVMSLFLQQNEVAMLKLKVSNISKELTPRQIRILIYRYLLARNLWRKLYEENSFEIETTIDVIIALSHNEPTNEQDIPDGLQEIVQMVVAY